MPLDHIRLVMFDMAGTTVDDRKLGPSLVVSCLIDALARAGVSVSAEQIGPHRGKEKLTAIRELLAENGAASGDSLSEQAVAIHAAFVDILRSRLDALTEMEGTRATFAFLKERGIAVGVGSGFPVEVVEAIVAKLGWDTPGMLDYVGCAERVGASRPDPKMIQQAMAQLGIVDPRTVVKVGDTVVDVQEGKNAGTWTVAVLTGSQSESELRRSGADHILASVAELPSLFE